MSEKENAILPQDDQGREQLREQVERGVRLLSEIDTLSDDIKEIAQEVHDANLTDKKNFVKLVKAQYKNDIRQKRQEAEEIEGALGILFGD